MASTSTGGCDSGRGRRARDQERLKEARTANLLTANICGDCALGGDLAWLGRASQTAAQSLHAVRAATNLDGLFPAALTRYESHGFLEAARLAQQFCASRPDDAKGFALLGDACVEAGDYAAADSAYRDEALLNSYLTKN